MSTAKTRGGGTSRKLLCSLALGLTAVLSTCAGRCTQYPISWQPDVFAPVFYGWEDLEPPAAPGKMRVWYPSLDGAPSGAPILSPSRGRFPLVILLHGQCSQQTEHYQTWFLLPAQLARSGYVVAVPELPAIQGGAYPWDASSDAPLVDSVISWMRTGWQGRTMLLPSPFTAMVGHSYGALLGGRMVAAAPANFKAFASLGGVWSEWPSVTPNPLGTLGVPSYFAWGDGDVFADVTPYWTTIAAPGHGAHRSLFTNGTHFDYWRTNAASSIPCDSNPGTCGLIGALTADLTTIFLSKYMPPEQSDITDGYIPDSFALPAETLTTEQQFYIGGHLTGLNRLSAPGNCALTLTWETAQGPGSRVLP